MEAKDAGTPLPGSLCVAAVGDQRTPRRSNLDRAQSDEGHPKQSARGQNGIRRNPGENRKLPPTYEMKSGPGKFA